MNLEIIKAKLNRLDIFNINEKKLIMKSFILIFILSFCAFQTNAQNRKNNLLLKQAKNEVSNFRYAYAIPLYKKYLILMPKDTFALKELAQTYQKVNRYDSAVLYFEKAILFGLKQSSLLAELYASVGQYDKSRIVYKSLIDSNKTKIAEARLYGFNHINTLLEDSLDYKIYNTKLNTPYNEFNGTYYNNGIIFESNRFEINKKIKHTSANTYKKQEFAWDGFGFTNLYFYPNLDSIYSTLVPTFNWIDKPMSAKFSKYSELSPNDSKKVRKNFGFNIISYNPNGVRHFDAFLSDKMNIGAVSFTEDGKKAYYTRNQKKSRGIYQLEIWEASFYNGKWGNARKMFFNNPNFSYFHPAITPNGQRLYYVSDDNAGFGGTDIYYIDKQPDGSWKNTTNLGQDINTEGNELFPTVYEGSLFISSNGHPGLGGLDIFKIIPTKKGDILVKNLGYPINSSKDDFSFSVKGDKGFFSTNRSGNDDILAYEHVQPIVTVNGKILLDSNTIAGKKVYLFKKDDNNISVLVDSATVNPESVYTFNVKPNKNYEILAFDEQGNKYTHQIISDGYIKSNDTYKKEVAIINIPLFEKEKQIKLSLLQSEKAAALAKLSKGTIKTIDSLKKLTKLYVELHHPFNQVQIVKNDLVDYYKLIEIVKRVKNKTIVIVSATDCNGSYDYNEDLSMRRANRIYKTLSSLSNNDIVIKNVGERELLKDCNDVYKNKEEQLINRYSYVYIIDKKTN